MTVGILLITHPGVGNAMLNIATRIIGKTTLPIKCLEVPPDARVEPVSERACSMLKVLNRGAGVLVIASGGYINYCLHILSFSLYVFCL